MISSDDQDLGIADQTVPGQRPKPRLGALIECGGALQIEAQLRGGGHLVDVLAARAGAADETDADVALRDGRCAAHGSRRSLINRTSCCATGIVMPPSRNRRQMTRLTSERTLFTPFCGSAIQKRSS